MPNTRPIPDLRTRQELADTLAKILRLGRGLGACVLLLALAGCPAPGEGPAARAGYDAAAPVIGALDRFHATQGHYPEKLEELVPGQIPAVPPELRYQRRDEASYELNFTYTGPGINQCIFTPATQWHCSGHY